MNPVIFMVVYLLGHPQWSTRENASRLLEAAGKHAKPQVAIAAMLHPDAEVRTRAAFVLEHEPVLPFDPPFRRDR